MLRRTPDSSLTDAAQKETVEVTTLNGTGSDLSHQTHDELVLQNMDPRRSFRTNRLRRLLRIALLAIERRRFDANSLAAFMGVSKRTIRRDLAELYDAGFEIRYDANLRSYRLFRVDLD
jgi:Fic family protein